VRDCWRETRALPDDRRYLADPAVEAGYVAREGVLQHDREQGTAERSAGWDTTQAVTEAVFPSRFVLDNGYSLEYAGRVIDRSDGHGRICPLTGHEARLAYRARKSRFWFTDAEAIELRTFLDQYRAAEGALPHRVKKSDLPGGGKRAVALPVRRDRAHTTGLEALLNTDEDVQITAQFVKRSKQLADELGIDGTSHTYWTWIYNARSRVVHGAEVELVAPEGWYEGDEEPPADVKKIAMAQDVLRAAVRRGSRKMTSAPGSTVTRRSRRGGRCRRSER
jgi:hypothetical protein